MEDERFTKTMGALLESEMMGRERQTLVLRVGASGDGEPRRMELSGPRVIVGAHASADVTVPDPSVSALHCSLDVEDGQVFLRDLGSKNGTWLGPVKVREVILQPGTSFEVGDAQITLVDTAERDVPVSLSPRFGRLFGRGETMGKLIALLSRLATVDVDVLVRGETGTGKEVVARSLHEESPRAGGPFVVLDCTGLNPSIVEGVLFGHKKGTFTGADADRAGLLEEANGGTLFIDEIGELPLDLQPKLLRALENRQTSRVGESAYRDFDAKIVAATHRDLLQMVNEGTFREDLYFRLGREVVIPPLRERGGSNVTMLADLFLDGVRGQREDGAQLHFDKSGYRELKSWAWSGNVRELKSLVQYAAKVSEGTTLTAEELKRWRRPAASSRGGGLTALPLRDARLDFERRYVKQLLDETGGNQSEASRRAGMNRGAFIDVLKRTGLK